MRKINRGLDAVTKSETNMKLGGPNDIAYESHLNPSHNANSDGSSDENEIGT